MLCRSHGCASLPAQILPDCNPAYARLIPHLQPSVSIASLASRSVNPGCTTSWEPPPRPARPKLCSGHNEQSGSPGCHRPTCLADGTQVSSPARRFSCMESQAGNPKPVAASTVNTAVDIRDFPPCVESPGTKHQATATIHLLVAGRCCNLPVHFAPSAGKQADS